MNERPLVSILIPARNAERWIGETLRSALGQTWPVKEVIVVDDGSTDGTTAVVNQCEAPELRLVARGAHTSASAARNCALQHARGEFIQFLDADDLLSADKIARQMARLAEDQTGSCVASGEWARFYQSTGEAKFEPEAVWQDMDATEWLIRAWTDGGPMMQPGLWLIPRNIAEQAGKWDERLTLFDDFEYFTRVLLASERVKFCPGARLYYRSGDPDSLGSRRSADAWRSALLSLELATEALLDRRQAPEARTACADMFQRLAFEAYLADPASAAAAEARAVALGGSSVEMDGGVLFTILRRALGWKRAKQLKQLAYSLGYERVARIKAEIQTRAA